MGFEEINPNQVRENIIIEDEFLISKANGKRFKHGKLEIPMLKTLRNEFNNLESLYDDKIKFEEIVANVRELHKTKKNATFQAASQFNLLEMVSPYVNPESGVDRYDNDNTQGPACAIACGAGTIYRNYFVNVNGQIGQSSKVQINCLEEIDKYFNNQENNYWNMQNGYAFVNRNGLNQISEEIKSLYSEDYEDLKSKLRIGLQKNTEVTISENKHTVTQVYCSALPIRYTNIDSDEWEVFARLILESLYESTFYIALKNFESTGNKELYLTLVGGGVFGNPISWIFDSIEKSILKFKNTPLDVKIVSYGGRKYGLNTFLEELKMNI